nr:myristoylated alanine-rich C-kinase substrate-like [Dermacentor andersoni]
MPVAPTEHSACAAPAQDAEVVALPAASHVPLVPALEEQSSAAGPAKQQATADKPTTASSQVLLATFAGHVDKQATPKPPEDVKAETEVSGVAAEASGSTPAAPIPSEAGGCASKEDARPSSAAAAHVSSAAEVVALPAASHVPLVPALEEQSSAAGPAKQQATADKPTTASSQVLLATFAGHVAKQATPKPPEDVKAETEVSGVAAEASGSTPAAPIPSEAGGCASKEDARPSSAAAAHVSSAAGAEATVLSRPPAKDVLGAGVTSAQDTVLASGTQAVTSPPVPPFKRTMILRERLKVSTILSPISLHLTSFDVAAMVRA